MVKEKNVDSAIIHMLGYLRGNHWRDALKTKPELKNEIKYLLNKVNKEYGSDMINEY